MPRRDPGRPPTCEDSLRALGRYLDFTGLAEISLTVREGDYALIARRGRDARQYPVQVRFTAPEIKALRNVTASQRGRGRLHGKRRPSRLRALRARAASAAPLSAWLEQEYALPYQELLRAIGRALDGRGVRAFELHESAADVVVHFATADSATPELHYLSKQGLRTHLDSAIRQRVLRNVHVSLPARVPPSTDLPGDLPRK